MNAVEMKNVRFAYTKDTWVLDGVDFAAGYGKITLLSGMSGDGKSTLLSIICGIIPNMTPGTLEGDVTVAGRDVRGMKAGEISRIVGCVLQNAELQIVQSVVEDEVAFGCENLAMPQEMIEKRVKAACAMMELDPSFKTRTLSGGQKQRLITAATLAMGQKIVILDEPLANLDKEGTHMLMTALRRLAGRGYCVIVSEHRLDMVLPYVDEVWNICRGAVRKVEDKQAYLHSQAEIISDGCAPYNGGRPVLTLSGVTKKFGRREILTGVDLTVYEGERLLILGQNGCGKTTLMRIIARLEKADGGDVAYSKVHNGYVQDDSFTAAVNTWVTIEVPAYQDGDQNDLYDVNAWFAGGYTGWLKIAADQNVTAVYVAGVWLESPTQA